MRSIQSYSAGLLLLAMALAAQGAEVSQFPFLKTLKGGPVDDGQPAVVALDEEVYAATFRAPAALRIFDDQGTEVPYLLRRRTLKRTVETDHPVPSKTLSLEQKQDDNSIEVILEVTEKNHTLSAMTLVSPLDNFEKVVSVWGSADRATWQALVENQPIFDYSRFMDVRNDRVDFTASTFLFYRVRISNITEERSSPFVQIARERRKGESVGEIETGSFRREDFRIDRIVLLEKKQNILEADPVLRAYAPTNVLCTVDAKEKESVVTFELPAVPLVEVTLVTEDNNFSRHAILERLAMPAPQQWRTLVAGRLARIHVGNIRRESLALRTSASDRGRQYRLRIQNHDNPPLQISGVTVRGEIHEAVFLPLKDRSYRLAFGGETTKAPQYDISAVLAEAPAAGSTEYSLTVQEDNPTFKQGRQGLSGPAGRRLLVVGVILAAATLFWVIARAARGIPPNTAE